MKRSPFRHVSWVILAVALLAPSVASAQTVVGLGASGFFEDSKLKGLQQIQVEKTDESYDYHSDGFLAAQLWFLLQLSKRIRVGSMLDYYGTYKSVAKCQQDQCKDPNFEPDKFEFGKLVEFGGRVEYDIPAIDKFDLVVGGVFGVPILFPGGDLRDEIDSLKEQGAAVFKVPRIGYFLGPNIAVRWRYSKHLALRADALVKWEQIFLFRTVQNIDGVAFRKRWTTGELRYEFGLGVEVAP